MIAKFGRVGCGGMRASFDELLGRPVEFPIELSLSSGEKYVLPHPDHAHIHPNHRDLLIYPEEPRVFFSIILNPDQIVSVRSLRKAS